MRGGFLAAAVLRIPSGFDFGHLPGQRLGRQNSLPKKDIREGHDPSLVVSELADHFRAERLHAATLLLGIDDLVIVENIGEGMAALLPGFERMVDKSDRLRRQAANVIGHAPHEIFSAGHYTTLPCSTLAGTTPIIVSRVT